MNKTEQMAAELKSIMYADTYSFEIDTQDFVFGFNKTLKKRTNSIAKAISLQAKLHRDCGRFLSDTVRIVAVRFYKNGELVKELIANQI